MTDTYTLLNAWHDTIEVPNSTDPPSASLVAVPAEGVGDNTAWLKARGSKYRIVDFIYSYYAPGTPTQVATTTSSSYDTSPTGTGTYESPGGSWDLTAGDILQIQMGFHVSAASSGDSPEVRLAYWPGSGNVVGVDGTPRVFSQDVSLLTPGIVIGCFEASSTVIHTILLQVRQALGSGGVSLYTPAYSIFTHLRSNA